jgi:MoaA/NifB/PqqE/SkfB family radical SAM enzyme
LNLHDPLIAGVDAEGRLVVPAELAARLGLKPGASVLLDEETNSFRVRRPVAQLAKVYVEPTSRCNLSCRTCIRNAWEEPLGDMSELTFSRVLAGLAAFDPLPEVFFGGFGEPLAHPRIFDMVERAKTMGVPRVELITNGCLLDEHASRRLIAAGLDTLWVSLDGIRPESYDDVRLGALLPRVLENVSGFRDVRREMRVTPLPPQNRIRYEYNEGNVDGYGEYRALPALLPQLGIVFVAMRRNIADLPELVTTSRLLGATRFLVTNVLAYTEDLVPEILYEGLLGMSPMPRPWSGWVQLPPMELTTATKDALLQATRTDHWSLADADVSGITRRCPFVEAGSTTITYTGDVSPCLPLTRTHTEFMGDQKRQIHKHVVGRLSDNDLMEIWSSPGYVDFRTRVQSFEFSPCIACGGCNFTEANEEDCLDYDFPRCGACLWSHGLIRCP